MMQSLDRMRQRQLAIGILVVAVALFLAVTAGPIWMVNASRQDALNQAQERLQRYRQIVARDADLLPQYEALLQAQKASGNHLRSDTVAVAGAELQRLVKTITTTNGAQIVSTQILPPGDEQGLVRVTLKVRLRGTLPSILRSLYDIETNSVFMFVGRLGMADNLVGRRRSDIQLRPMDADFDLVAYMPDTT